MSVPRLTFALFLVFQISDGLITYAAVSIFGVGAEGNPLLATWMRVAGPGVTLAGAKLVACGSGALLYALGMQRTLAILTALYLFAAVGPWLHVLSDDRYVFAAAHASAPVPASSSNTQR